MPTPPEATEVPFLFLAGSGRSGTTLLHRLLTLHAGLCLTNEAGVADLCRTFAELARVPAWQAHRIARGTEVDVHGWIGRSYLDRFTTIATEAAIAALLRFYREEFPDRTPLFYGDKLPEAETVVALQQVLPEVRAIVLTRDPRDVFCSVRAFGERPEVRDEHPFLADADASTFAEYWKNLHLGLESYVKLHTTRRYEDLIEDPVPVVRSLWDWLVVDHTAIDDETIRAGNRYDGHGTSKSQSSSRERWRTDLDEADRNTIESVCGEVMLSLGYRLD